VKWLDDEDTGRKDCIGVVHEVHPGSPAANAGIRIDDQLEYWEDFKLDSKPAWESKVRNIYIGQRINMGIHRNHQDQRVNVEITGTDRAKSGSKVVRSQTATHSDNV
jgi:S1-C subfamily serine protease